MTNNDLLSYFHVKDIQKSLELIAILQQTAQNLKNFKGSEKSYKGLFLGKFFSWVFPVEMHQGFKILDKCEQWKKGLTEAEV